MYEVRTEKSVGLTPDGPPPRRVNTVLRVWNDDTDDLKRYIVELETRLSLVEVAVRRVARCVKISGGSTLVEPPTEAGLAEFWDAVRSIAEMVDETARG